MEMAGAIRLLCTPLWPPNRCGPLGPPPMSDIKERSRNDRVRADRTVKRRTDMRAFVFLAGATGLLSACATTPAMQTCPDGSQVAVGTPCPPPPPPPPPPPTVCPDGTTVPAGSACPAPPPPPAPLPPP